MPHLPTHLLGLQTKADAVVFGSAVLRDIPTAEVRARSLNGIGRDHTARSFPYLAAEQAVRKGSRSHLGNSRVRVAVFGHALSALVALQISAFMDRGRVVSNAVVPHAVFDALTLLPAGHAAVHHKYTSALAVLGLPDGTGADCVRWLFGRLGVQQFLTTPLKVNSAVGEGLLARIATLPFLWEADAAGAGMLRAWYLDALAAKDRG